jgi:hypothetical protein
MRDRAPRYEVRIGAELRLGTTVLTGTTRNLSEAGVCVEITRPLGEGADLAVLLFSVEDEVEAEGARGLLLSGRVQWCAESDSGGYAVGLRFLDLQPAQAEGLRRALQVAAGA